MVCWLSACFFLYVACRLNLYIRSLTISTSGEIRSFGIQSRPSKVCSHILPTNGKKRELWLTSFTALFLFFTMNEDGHVAHAYLWFGTS